MNSPPFQFLRGGFLGFLLGRFLHWLALFLELWREFGVMGVAVNEVVGGESAEEDGGAAKLRRWVVRAWELLIHPMTCDFFLYSPLNAQAMGHCIWCRTSLKTEVPPDAAGEGDDAMYPVPDRDTEGGFIALP
ncbi:uncharacterized protein G2W53_038301 [Senna tora]|uniref:Uncharacterized protein n=1 Tax=Senna tora TaxID=362788 RepID=A0A834SKP4_9FABA|nr:uncharacterized protein G2W53_038301 [Senna tora]